MGRRIYCIVKLLATYRAKGGVFAGTAVSHEFRPTVDPSTSTRSVARMLADKGVASAVVEYRFQFLMYDMALSTSIAYEFAANAWSSSCRAYLTAISSHLPAPCRIADSFDHVRGEYLMTSIESGDGNSVFLQQ